MKDSTKTAGNLTFLNDDGDLVTVTVERVSVVDGTLNASIRFRIDKNPLTTAVHFATTYGVVTSGEMEE